MVVALCAAFGAGAAGVAASCGDDDNGRVEVEGGTTGTSTTTGTATTGTSTTGTTTAP